MILATGPQDVYLYIVKLRRSRLNGLEEEIMPRAIYRSVGVLLLFVLVGCAPGAQPLISVPTTPDRSKIIVYRPDNYYGRAWYSTLFVNNQPIAHLPDGSYAEFEIESGWSMVSVRQWDRDFREADYQYKQFIPGQEYCFEIEPNKELFFPIWGLLEELADSKNFRIDEKQCAYPKRALAGMERVNLRYSHDGAPKDTPLNP